jgi:hypothetical protein
VKFRDRMRWQCDDIASQHSTKTIQPQPLHSFFHHRQEFIFLTLTNLPSHTATLSCARLFFTERLQHSLRSAPPLCLLRQTPQPPQFGFVSISSALSLPLALSLARLLVGWLVGSLFHSQPRLAGLHVQTTDAERSGFGCSHPRDGFANDADREILLLESQPS